jgi:hypothetical protein
MFVLQVKQAWKEGKFMKMVSKSIRVNPALWNHVRGIALQRGLTMQTLVERLLTCYSVRSDWQERVDQAITTNLDRQKRQ